MFFQAIFVGVFLIMFWEYVFTILELYYASNEILFWAIVSIYFMHFVCVCVCVCVSSFFEFLPFELFVLIWFFFLMWILCCKQVQCMGHMRLLGLRYLSDLISNLQPWDCVAFTYDYSSSSLLLSVKIKFHALFSFHFWYDLSKILSEGYHVNVSSFLVLHAEQFT